MTLMAAYFAVMAEVFLATNARGVFRMSFFGFGPTELRVVLAVGALALLRDPKVTFAGLGPFQLFDVGGAVAVAGLAVTFLTSAAANARALYLEEPVMASCPPDRSLTRSRSATSPGVVILVRCTSPTRRSTCRRSRSAPAGR
jgi:hypothetical protein